MSTIFADKDRSQSVMNKRIGKCIPLLVSLKFSANAFFSPKLKTRHNQKANSKAGRSPDPFPVIDNPNGESLPKEMHRLKLIHGNPAIGHVKTFKLEVGGHQGVILNQAYKLDQKLVNHLHLMGIPLPVETNDNCYGLDHFLKIKAVTLSSTQAVASTGNKVVKSPPPPRHEKRSKTKHKGQDKKNSFLDASFDKYGDREDPIYYSPNENDRIRRSFSGSKQKGFDIIGLQVMSDIEDDSASNRGNVNQLMQDIIDRKIRSAAGKQGDLYSMRYKPGYQDTNGLDISVKKITSEEHPYSLIQRQVGSVPKNIGESIPKHVGISTSIKFVGMPGATKEMIMNKSKQSFVYSDYRTQTTKLMSSSALAQNAQSKDTTNLLNSILKNNKQKEYQNSNLNKTINLPQEAEPAKPNEISTKFLNRGQNQTETMTPKSNTNNPNYNPTFESTPNKEREENASLPTNTTTVTHLTNSSPPPRSQQQKPMPPPQQKKVNPISNNGYGRSISNSFNNTSKPQPKSEPKPVTKKIIVAPNPTPHIFKYYVGYGNNGELIKQIISGRDWWQETEQYNGNFNFRWQQTGRSFRYEKLIGNPNLVQVFNHFEFHREISTKNMLIKNMATYCEANKLNLFDITPTTFVFDMDDEVNFDTDMQKFARYFVSLNADQNKYPKPDPNDKKNGATWFNFDYRKRKGFVAATTLEEKQAVSEYVKPKLHQTFLRGFNVWVLKPTGLNRGRGIEVFNTLESLNKYLNEYFEGATTRMKRAREEAEGDSDSDSSDDGKIQKYRGQIFKSHTFVIQKYIENLMVVNKRKFDIRVWALVTHDMQLFFCREGYLRTTCYEYDLTAENIDNKFVHLTNNAVQKHCDDYGEFESGNQLSFKDFDKYIASRGLDIDFRGKIVPKIKEDIFLSMDAVKKKLDVNDRKHCFELFGYDFMIDAEGNTWLIEVNTNPCIELSSPILERIIPRMLDDAFKLTLDVIFPKPQKKNNRDDDDDGDSDDASVASQPLTYTIDGYKDSENIWELLGSIQTPKVPVVAAQKTSNLKQGNPQK